MRASSLRTSSTFWLKTPRPKTPGQAFVSTELDIQECIGNATRWKSFGSEMISNTHIVSHPRNEKRLKQSEARKSGPEPEWHPINDCASPPKTAEQPAKKEQAKESNDSAQPKPKSTGLKKQTAIGGNVDEAFHTYGCWWKDANTLEFYLDGKPVHTIHPPTDVDERPFSRPMMVNMVCEIYTWEDAPELKNLTDDSKNTTYYDYVRAYRLVPVE